MSECSLLYFSTTLSFFFFGFCLALSALQVNLIRGKPSVLFVVNFHHSLVKLWCEFLCQPRVCVYQGLVFNDDGKLPLELLRFTGKAFCTLSIKYSKLNANARFIRHRQRKASNFSLFGRHYTNSPSRFRSKLERASFP